MLIYQAENGGDNTGKTPKGGVIYQSSPASSMLTTIASPITFYGGLGDNRTVINQDGHTKDLYDYYCTSYSRGTDGMGYPTNAPSWHNVYLDGYIPLRVKSIYDPCPYLYRIPSNGTYNQFTSNPGWTWSSYLGGVSWNLTNLGESWLLGSGLRYGSSTFGYNSNYIFYRSSTSGNQSHSYILECNAGKGIWTNRNNHDRFFAISVRCIEESILKYFAIFVE